MASKLRVEMDFGTSNGKYVFRSTEETRQFFSEEFSKWDWVRHSGLSSLSNIYQQLVGGINNGINQITDDVDGKSFAPLIAAVREYYASRNMPLASSAFGKFVLDLKAQSAVEAAACLSSHFASSTNARDLDVNNSSHIKGAVAYALFTQGVDKRTPSTVKKALEDVRSRFEAAAIEAGDRLDHDLKQREEEWKNRKEEITQSISDIESDYSEFIEEAKRAFLEEIEKLKVTQQTFEEFMKLKAPVTYWSNKANEHTENAKLLLFSLKRFASIATLILVAALSALAFLIVQFNIEDKSTSVQVILVSIGVIVTTVVFWIGRVLTRLFLSQRHLAIDADERATMIHTYMALTSNSAATQDERAIVLASVFRSASDGIVKDDGAPDISPAAFISKSIGRPSS